MFASSNVSYKSCILYQYLEITLTIYDHLSKEEAMKIKKLFREIETSSESVRTFNYVKYFGLQHCEAGVPYDAHEYLLQYLAKTHPVMNDDCMFKINKVNTF